MKSSLQTRERILNSAAYYFSKYGYHQTNIKEIAEKANTAVGSIYYYYPLKKIQLPLTLFSYFWKRVNRIAAHRLSPDLDHCAMLCSALSSLATAALDKNRCSDIAKFVLPITLLEENVHGKNRADPDILEMLNDAVSERDKFYQLILSIIKTGLNERAFLGIKEDPPEIWKDIIIGITQGAVLHTTQGEKEITQTYTLLVKKILCPK